MQSFRQSKRPSLPKFSPQIPVTTELLISLSSLSLVSSLAIAQAIAHQLSTMGQASEELFRGDRLPSLPLMNSDSDQT